MRFLVSLLRRQKRLRRPLTAIHHTIWRASGMSGVAFLRPEVGALRTLARKSRAGAQPSPSSADRILIFSFRGWATHVVPDVLLGHALRLRGADVSLFTCGGRLPICDITSHILAPPMPCNVCAPFVTESANAVGLPHYDSSHFITAGERRALDRRVETLPVESFGQFVVEGIPVGELVQPSLQWFLLTGTPDRSPEAVDAYRRFLVSGAIQTIVSGRLLDRLQPSVLYLLNGVFFAERIAIEQARRRGIRFITHESGFMPDSHVYIRDGLVPYHDLGAFWGRYAAAPLTATEERLLDDFLDRRMAGRTDTTTYYPVMEADRNEIVNTLGLDVSRPIVTLFTNVDWDTAAFAPRAAFPNMEEWICRTIALFAERTDVQLVIRVHPAEVRLPYYLAPRVPVEEMLARRFGALPPNVRVVPPSSGISSYTLMDLSALGLVYTSTVGMELSLKGKPVVVAGRAYYANRGFTLDLERADAYEATIDTALQSGTLGANEIALARRYAFLFFFRYHLPFRALRSTWDTVVPAIQSLDELAAGRDQYLDLLCDAILKDRPLLYEGSFEPDSVDV